MGDEAAFPPIATRLSPLLTRRSIRRTTAQRVPQDVLARLLALAIWAPNAHNRQPWRFAAVTTPDAQARLADALAQRWLADLTRDRGDPDAIQRRVDLSRQRIAGAGALVLACLTMVEMDLYPDPDRQRLEETMAVQSVALAVGHLLLAAHAEGLGGCWLCAPLFAPDLARQALDLPADWQPQALITLGYPAETRTSTRRPLDEVVLWR